MTSYFWKLNTFLSPFLATQGEGWFFRSQFPEAKGNCEAPWGLVDFVDAEQRKIYTLLILVS